jgi:hypothetical protein
VIGLNLNLSSEEVKTAICDYAQKKTGMEFFPEDITYKSDLIGNPEATLEVVE